jgi:Fe-S cluster assembly ATP-binding protein
MLKTALTNIENTDYSTLELRLKVADAMKDLGLSPDFVDRYLNEGFSGGERKRNEILQLAVLNPKLAILDETDSGLDVDGLRIVGEGISKLRTPERGYLVVTHYQRLLEYITPDFVHVKNYLIN